MRSCMASSVLAVPRSRLPTCAEVLEGKDFGRVEHVDRVEGGNGRARSPSGPQPVGRRVPTPQQSGGPRPVAAVKGILIAALFAALVGGAWWWLGGGDGTIGTNGTTGTNVVQGLDFPSPVLPVPSGPTESDVTDIAVEATVQKARVERIDDADGFRAKKIALADDFTRATANGKSRRWADAAQPPSVVQRRMTRNLRRSGVMPRITLQHVGQMRFGCWNRAMMSFG